MNFIDLQKLLKEKLGIDHLADIAREFGVTPQAVSNWKSRDKVPYKYIVKIRKQIEEKNNQVSFINEDLSIESNDSGNNQKYSTYFEEESISIIDILVVIANNLRIIILIPTYLCLAMIVYVLFLANPIYESKSKIMSSDASSNTSSQASGLAAQFGFSLPSGKSGPNWEYTEIIKSRTLAYKLLKRKFDTKKYGPQKSLLQIITYGNNKPKYSLDTLQILAVDRFIDMIEISEDLKSNIYTIKLFAPEPKFARELNFAIIEELDLHQREYNKSISSETRQFIEERIIETEKELNTAEEALKNFRDSNRRIENSPSLLLEQQRMSREVSVLTGVFTTLKQQLETAKIEEVKDSDYVIVLDEPETPLFASWPNKRLLVILAAIVGFFISLLIIFINQLINNDNIEKNEEFSSLKSLFIDNFFNLIFFKKR